MVDECEDGQSAALDPRYQRGHRRSESASASVSDHFASWMSRRKKMYVIVTMPLRTWSHEHLDSAR
jgi:hypothetical protein